MDLALLTARLLRILHMAQSSFPTAHLYPSLSSARSSYYSVDPHGARLRSTYSAQVAGARFPAQSSHPARLYYAVCLSITRRGWYLSRLSAEAFHADRPLVQLHWSQVYGVLFREADFALALVPSRDVPRLVLPQDFPCALRPQTAPYHVLNIVCLTLSKCCAGSYQN